MDESSLGAIRPATESDLEQILSWRNHPNVRQYMYSQHEISPEEHAQWFAKISHDPKKHLLVFEVNKTPLGVVSINQIASCNEAEWGFYTAPDAPKGTGHELGVVTLRYAFNVIRLHKLCAQVLAFNERSIRFHLNLGFQREGFLMQKYFDGRRYHKIECFGLIASEWYKANGEENDL